MKRVISSLCALLLLFPAALPVLAADHKAELLNTAYSDDAEKVSLYLYTESELFWQTKTFALQRKENDAWVPLKTKTGAPETKLLSIEDFYRPGKYFFEAQISDFRQGDRFPPGEYRLCLRHGDGFLYVPFPVAEGDVLAPASQYSAKTEYPVYDANAESIDVLLSNHTDDRAGHYAGFKLQRLNGTQWTNVPGVKQSDTAYGQTLPTHWTVAETVPLTGAARPLPPGQYRLVKEFTLGQRVAAPFEILSPDGCMKLDQPAAISITLNGDTFHVTPGSLSKLWHSLLSFQGGQKPAAPGDAYARIALTSGGKQTTVSLYETNGSIWAETGGSWYRSDGILSPEDLAAVKRKETAPKTGEELAQRLNGLAPLRNVAFAAHAFSEPFSLPGWISDRSSGVTISIFQFPERANVDVGTAVDEMGGIRDNGYARTVYSNEGKAGARRYEWAQPPHYFMTGSLVTLYNGSDGKILDALTALLGPEIVPMEQRAGSDS